MMSEAVRQFVSMKATDGFGVTSTHDDADMVATRGKGALLAAAQAAASMALPLAPGADMPATWQTDLFLYYMLRRYLTARGLEPLPALLEDVETYRALPAGASRHKW
jgi:hypothetical protein